MPRDVNATMPKAIADGEIQLGDAAIACYVLDNEQRVLATSQVQGLIGAAEDRTLSRGLARIPGVSEDLRLLPIEFSPLRKGPSSAGYDADAVVKILRAYQRAYLRNELHYKQVPIALAAMTAIESFVSVGLRALIDEATGYQVERPSGDLQAHLTRVIADQRRLWEEMFDADWDRAVCQLYRHPYTGRPPRFAAELNHKAFLWAFGAEAYERIKELNPHPKFGSNHHQLLTDEARIKLSQTIATLKHLMKVSRSPQDFRAKAAAVYDDVPLQLGWG